MAMTTKDKKRMIDVFFDGDEEKTDREVRKALDDVAQLTLPMSYILISEYTEMQQKVVDSDMTNDELKLLLKKYSTESLNNPTPAILDKRRMGPEGKPVSLYFGEYAAQERQRRARSQAEADQFLLEQKINRLKEDTI
tara:strand:- start:1643 stop:2056 length:414 start_codon:yes stop_codon:yes gene_type:complete